MVLNISIKEKKAATTDHFEDLKPRILVIGVGGAGGNAVNNMIRSNLEGVDFLVCNTDAQALGHSTCDYRIQLGREVTKGLGAGSKPEVGRAAAQENIDELREVMGSTHMVFIAAGMGGGTGTGAAPVIAQAARDLGILTVGIVTKPFHFEGQHRMRSAEAGIEELQQYVDTLIVIPNQNLFRLANEKTTFADAFKMADDVLYSGVRGVTDLMVMPGLINLDFADIRTVMSEMGKAMMGTGESDGEKRAIRAAEAAISNPLLDDVSMKGARGVLINITGGMDMTLFEVDEAANRIRDEVDPNANIIFGSTFEEGLQGKIRVSVVATGIEGQFNPHRAPQTQPAYQPNIFGTPQTKPAQPAVKPVLGLDNQLYQPNIPGPSAVRDDHHFIPPKPLDVPASDLQDADSRRLQSNPTAASYPSQSDISQGGGIVDERLGGGELARMDGSQVTEPYGQIHPLQPSTQGRESTSFSNDTTYSSEKAELTASPAAQAAQKPVRQSRLGLFRRDRSPNNTSQELPRTHVEPTHVASAAAPTQKAPVQTSLNMEDADGQNTQNSENVLDIPAFLRRQAK